MRVIDFRRLLVFAGVVFLCLIGCAPKSAQNPFPPSISGDLSRDDEPQGEAHMAPRRLQSRSVYKLAKAKANRPTGLHKAAFAANVVTDPGFESGSFSAWSQCGSVDATISKSRPHSGVFAARMGGTIKGDAGICQAMTIPSRSNLVFWVRQSSSEIDTTFEWQEADLFDAHGVTLVQFYRTVNNDDSWTEKTFDISAYAGQTLYLYFGVHGDGFAHAHTIQYVDDVSIVGGSGASSPSPVASPISSASPTTTPTSAPPTPLPSGSNTPLPSPSPIATAVSCQHCGVQRWHLKTLTDPEAGSVSFTPVSATVAQLVSFNPPGDPSVALPDDQRFGPVELQTYTIQGTFVGWKVENDQDFHMVIADLNDSSKTMIVEAPSIQCSSACASPYGSDFQQVRDTVTTCLGQPPTTFTAPPGATTVEVTGVGFFDRLHGQIGVAPTGLELHPVLSLTWLSGSCH